MKRVFAAAKAGAIFVFMDASYHLWDEVEAAMAEVAKNYEHEFEFELVHPSPQPWQCANTMLAVKSRGRDVS